jgi:hypothetical protein
VRLSTLVVRVARSCTKGRAAAEPDLTPLLLRVIRKPGVKWNRRKTLDPPSMFLLPLCCGWSGGSVYSKYEGDR